MKNNEISDMLNEIADILSVDERPKTGFEVRAYKRAAQSVESLEEDINEIYKRGGRAALMDIPGVGEGISRSIMEYLETGHMKKYDKLKKEYPIDFRELRKIEGMGPKRLITLYKRLGVKDVKGLKAELKKHTIKELEGFGAKSEELIARGIEVMESGMGRVLLGDALPEAEWIAERLSGTGLVDRVEIAGSIRRMRETSGDIDILVASTKPRQVMDLFSKMDNVDRVIVKGDTKTTVHLRMGINCDLRVIPTESFGSALQYFTGSKYHNVSTRKIAIKKGYKLSEYGLFDKNGKDIAKGKDEQYIYKELGMQYIPPEMREDRGEIELAMRHGMPKLVELSDIKGDLHTHTKDTDGSNTIEEMAEAAISSGLEYFATTNHTKSLKVAKGMDDKQFGRFFKKVDALNKRLDGRITVLKGAEVDILRDGTLDLENKTLKSMDCVVGSVHSAFNMGRYEMTDRIVVAIRSGLIDILGHPTGRVLLGRGGYDIDIERVAEAAEQNRVSLEIDATPSRLDLGDTNIMASSKYKINFSIGSDAHSTKQFKNLRYGVGTARRGWLPRDRIINCMDLKELKKTIGR